MITCAINVYPVIAASMAFLFSVCINVTLFALQARNINKLSLPVPALLFLSYLIWTVYSLLAGDWAIIAGQGFGMLTNGVILGRLIYDKLK